MTDGPFTDEMLKHGLATVQTQHGIIKYAEAMAQVLAEAGRASKRATGDSAEYAVHQWSRVILDRALELLRSDPPTGMRKKLLTTFAQDQRTGHVSLEDENANDACRKNRE